MSGCDDSLIYATRPRRRAGGLVQIALLAVNLVVLLLIAGQLFLVNLARRADHERRRKQITLEFFADQRDAVLASSTVLRRTVQDPGAISSEEARALADDEAKQEILDALRANLNSWERLAVGVNTAVLDLEIVSRLTGTASRRTFRRYQPYIELMRTRRNQPTLYHELEELTQKLERRVTELGGSIRHS